MTEVTVSTSFRAEALACSTQRGLSRVTGYIYGNRWLDLVCLGVFIKLLAKKGRNTMGYGVKILKVNRNKASTDRTLQRTKAK
jgi:hypothetical protein